jgi:hypothetical protein
MNSLKQLSFLASGNIVNGNTTPQQTQAQPQPAYQTAQSYHPYQQHFPSNKQQFQQNVSKFTKFILLHFRLTFHANLGLES